MSVMLSNEDLILLIMNAIRGAFYEVEQVQYKKQWVGRDLDYAVKIDAALKGSAEAMETFLKNKKERESQ